MSMPEQTQGKARDKGATAKQPGQDCDLVHMRVLALPGGAHDGGEMVYHTGVTSSDKRSALSLD
jgi:hypothetical protein